MRTCKCGCGRQFIPNTPPQVFYGTACRNKFNNPRSIIKMDLIKIWAKSILSGQMSILTLSKMGLSKCQKTRVFKTVSHMQCGRGYHKK